MDTTAFTTAETDTTDYLMNFTQSLKFKSLVR